MKPNNMLRHAILAAFTLAIAGPVLAQTEEAAGEAQEAGGILEEIIVTGSRLRRDSFNISTPLVTMDAQAIQDTGLAHWQRY